MRTHRFVLRLFAPALLCAVVQAQGPPQLNEVYASMAGTDDLEYIELIGPPGVPLDGHMVLIVEGEGTGAGTLDRVWNLAGQVMPADGFFVLGDTAEPASDFDIGASNRIENGTETIYLIETSNPQAIEQMLGTDVSNGPNTTVIPGLALIHDLVAPVDGDFPGSDVVFDGAPPIGPDGAFFPAGIYRGGDAPGGWCGASFLDFDPAVNTNQPRTPGMGNVGCQPGMLTIFGLDHLSVGQAGVRGLDTRLVVSNIGSSGCDGVSIDLGEITELASGELLAPSVLPPNARCTTTAFGSVGGMPGRPIALLGGQILPGPEVQVTPDFSPIGASTSSVELRINGQTIFQQSGLSGPGCRFPIPPSCIGSCGTLPGGSPGTVIEFPAGPQPVTIPGGPTILADTMVMTPDNPTAQVDFVERVEMLAADVPMFEIVDEALRHFGRDHRSIGAGRLEPSGGRLTVSNIGSSGKDGVSIDLGDTDIGFELELAPVDLSVPNTGIVVGATGSFNGMPNTSLGSAGCMNNGGQVQASADFQPLGASGVKIEAYFRGQFQGSAVVPMGVVGTVTAGPGGPPLITGCGKLPPDPPCFFVVVDPPGVFTPTGSTTGLPFDCVRLLADGTMGTIDHLSRFDVQGVDLGSVRADDERDRTRFGGLTHRDIGAARLERPAGGGLVVSNIGSSGCDGVSIDLGETPNFVTGELTFLPPSLPPGLTCVATALGEVGGASGRTVSSLTATALPGPVGQMQIEPDFSPLGSSTHTVELFENGQPVFQQTGNSGPGCIFPPPPSCVGTCGVPVPGGPAFIRIDFPGSTPVSIPGGPTVQADRIVLTAENPATSPEDLEDLILTALCPFWEPFLPLAELSNEGIGIFDRLHTAEGEAEMSPGHDHLTVSNIGSSGCDGVSIEVGDPNTGFLANLEPVSLPNPGDGIFVSASGTIAGMPSSLGTAGCQNNGGIVQASADFSALGSSQVRVEVFDGGVFVGAALVQGGGVVGTVDPGPTGPPAIRAVGKVLPHPPCFVIMLDRIGVFTPVGGPPLAGDQVRLRATQSGGPLELMLYRILGGNLPSMTITGEQPFDPGPGTNYCTASLNSTGSGGIISAAGDTTANPLNLTLMAAPVPNTAGLFFFGPNMLATEPPFGEGVRCVGGVTQRVFPLVAGQGNVATQVLDGGANYAAFINPGSSLNFQYWFREAMNAGDLDGDGMVEPFNTSNAINIVFQ